MGDHHGGTVLHKICQCLAYHLFALGIQIGGCLIQQQIIGITHHGPGNGNALALSAGEVGATHSHRRIEPAGSSHNKIVDICQLRHPNQFILFHLSTYTVENILPNSSGQQGLILRDNSEGSAPGRQIIFFDIFLTKTQHAAVRVIHPLQQLEQCGLACTVRTHDGSDLPLGNPEVYTVQSRRVAVRKADILRH